MRLYRGYINKFIILVQYIVDKSYLVGRFWQQRLGQQLRYGDLKPIQFPQMKRLLDIVTDRTLAVQVKCIVNESVIDRNFEAIIDCLKDLTGTSNQLKTDVSSTAERTDKCEKDIQKILRELATLTGKLDSIRDMQPQSKGNKDEEGLTVGRASDADLLEELRKKIEEEIERNKKNNLENLKDINLLLRDVKEIKQRLDGVDSKVDTSIGDGLTSAGRIGSASELGGGSELEMTRVVQNEMQRQLELINKLFAETDSLKNADGKLHNKINKLEGILKNTSSNGDTHQSQGNSDESNLKSQVDKHEKQLDILEQKLRMVTNFSDVDNNINELRGWFSELQQNVNHLQEEMNDLKKRTLEEAEHLKTQNTANTLKQDVTQSRKDRQADQQHDNEHKWLRETLKNAVERIEELEKLIKENRERLETSIREFQDTTKSDNKEKLPSINRRSLKAKRQSNLNNSRQHANSGNGGGHLNKHDLDRKMMELKGELQHWLKQLFDSKNNGNKFDDEFFKDLELKMQELKMGLERKADQESMRKYLTFLESKINQLFMVLAQPESQDALIARKGWGCLSCAKKLEKYKGRLGDHLNWNNFTTTNYSPPRIGFTHTQYNQRSDNKGKFGSNERNERNDRHHSFGYDEQAHHDE